MASVAYDASSCEIRIVLLEPVPKSQSPISLKPPSQRVGIDLAPGELLYVARGLRPGRAVEDRGYSLFRFVWEIHDRAPQVFLSRESLIPGLQLDWEARPP